MIWHRHNMKCFGLSSYWKSKCLERLAREAKRRRERKLKNFIAKYVRVYTQRKFIAQYVDVYVKNYMKKYRHMYRKAHVHQRRHLILHGHATSLHNRTGKIISSNGFALNKKYLAYGILSLGLIYFAFRR